MLGVFGDVQLMESELLRGLANKSLTKAQLLSRVERNSELLPAVLQGVSSSKPAIRYGCAHVLMDLSEKHPETLYPHMDFFINLLSSRHRILTWNALAIIANLTKVDKNRTFDAAFNKYFSLLNDEYMVTVASVVGNSSKIALAKPHLVQKITDELLKVENLSTTPHLTEECKRVIIEKTIKSFDLFFDVIASKEKVISFVKRHTNSPRRTLKREAENFLKEHGQTK